MRRHHFAHTVFAAASLAALLASAAPLWAQTAPPTGEAAKPFAQTGIPRIVIGQTVITLIDRSRQPFRDPADNYVCVPPEAVASALGTAFVVDDRAGTATFTNRLTGATVTATLRVPPRDSGAKGAFVALTPLAESLGGKCEYEAATNTLRVRSVLTLVEIIGSDVRVTGTLPLSPKVTITNGGKTVIFDFPGAEVGLLPRNLSAVSVPVKKARTGQFDSDTARVVLDLTAPRPYEYVPPSAPSTIAVLSSPAMQPPIVASAPVVPPVSVTVDSSGKVITKTAPIKSAPVAKPGVPTVLKGVRFVNVSDTQAKIIVDAANAPAIKTLLTRARLTLDVQNGVFAPTTTTTLPEATHPLLRGVQTVNTSATTAQMVIDLSRAVNYTVRLNPKGGFVIDLTLPKGAGGRIAGKLIVVDPGHGGTDGGARGVNGAQEKNVALAIARKLANELRDRGANVILTRDSDAFVTLGERSEIANRAGADLFIAVHADSAGSSATGSNTYYHLNDPSGRTLATCVADRVAAMGGIRSRGARSDGKMYTTGFSVLRRTSALSILCETGYMSNRHDASLLVQSDMQARIARAIASGVQDYIEGNTETAWETAPEPADVAASPSPSPGANIAAPTIVPQRKR